nr:thioredoxin family protein [Mycobacterium sp. 1245805.9]
MTVVVALVAAVLVAGLAGWLLTRRSGHVREIAADRGDDPDTAGLGLSRTGPTIVHFSAAWCGPCDRVRRVVHQLCQDMGEVAHLEIDLDADPATARRFSVLSLPTTLIFDADGRQRYRASGVPKPADLRSVLQPLLA